jgi:ubiquinone/menaquinone biosynthesis C-methylase UbiE
MFTKSTKYYDTIYANGGKDYAKEAELIHQFIQKHKRSEGDSLLDVACGTGGHLVYLKKKYQIEGVELDETMLDIARKKLPEIPIHQADMLDLALPSYYDVLVCLFSSIGYVHTLDNLKLAVGNMARHTNPGGLVIIEPWLSPEQFNIGTVYADYVDNPELKIARMNVSTVEEGISILDFHYLVGTGEGIEYFQERHELGLFNHEEYLSAFEAADLDVVYDQEGLLGRGLYIGIKPIEK